MRAEGNRNVKVIITRNVKEYRRAALNIISENERVLEIGCGFGKTIEKIAKIKCRILGVDKSMEAIEYAKSRLMANDNVSVALVDAMDIKSLLKVVREHLNGKVDVVLIDIGGVEDPGKVLNLTRRCIKALKPKAVIVKNELLYDFISMCELYSQ